MFVHVNWLFTIVPFYSFDSAFQSLCQLFRPLKLHDAIFSIAAVLPFDSTTFPLQINSCFVFPSIVFVQTSFYVLGTFPAGF
jgi:hypothetical protein